MERRFQKKDVRKGLGRQKKINAETPIFPLALTVTWKEAAAASGKLFGESAPCVHYGSV
jgi:hypothetical protein